MKTKKKVRGKLSEVGLICLRTDFFVVDLLTNRYCVVLKRISEVEVLEVPHDTVSADFCCVAEMSKL